jgi:hypothetical protein
MSGFRQFMPEQATTGGTAAGLGEGAVAPTSADMGFSGFGGEAAAGTQGSAGSSGSSFLSTAGPYAALAAAIYAKARHTQETSGISLEDQFENPSLAPMADFDFWELERFTPFGGGDVYKSTFELATGDVGNWWEKGVMSPIQETIGRWFG